MAQILATLEMYGPCGILLGLCLDSIFRSELFILQ